MLLRPRLRDISIANGIHLSYGNLTLGSEDGGTTTLAGASVITNDSTLNATGGRYQSDPFVLAAHMTVSNGSTADFSHAPLQGTGTLEVGDDGTVDIGRTIAGLHINVDRGGMLFASKSGILSSYQSANTAIHEAAGGVVDILNNVTGSNLEVFHRSTGILDLYHSGALLWHRSSSPETQRSTLPPTRTVEWT